MGPLGVGGLVLIATACPYCAIMLRDGVAQLGRDDLPTKDIAEIVAESLGDN